MVMDSKIERARRERGLAIYQVAMATGISEQRLYRALKGRVKQFTLDEMRKVAGVLGLPEDDVRAELEDFSRRYLAAFAGSI